MLFKRVYLEIGNICNLRCAFCSPPRRPRRQMSEAEFRRAAEQLRPYTDYLYLHIKGEPLCHPQLGRFLEICGELGYQVNITTNATLLGQKGDLLLESPAVRQVNLSLHSFSAHDGIDRQAYLDTALTFAKAMSRKGRFTVLRFWNLDGDREAAAGTGVLLQAIKAAFPGHEQLEQQMATHRSVCLDKGIFVSFEEEFVWPQLEHPLLPETGFCHGLRQMLGVLADGTVVPCCLDADGQAPLGNLFEEPLAEILGRDPFCSARRGFFDRKVLLPLCRHCSYRLRFDKKPLPSDTRDR
ncbi:MAG: radical SAM protein [Oscillospiraceae bacterium]|nr:radical SAM protein [Oscillospiraceae bacterium]